MNKECPNFNCNRPKDCCSTLKKVSIPAVMGDDSEGSPVAPCNGAYQNALVEYEANGALYIYSSDGIFTKLYYTTDELSGMASKEYVDTGDARTYNRARDLVNSSEASLREYADSAVADGVADAEAFATNAANDALDQAREYIDSATGGAITQTYVDDADAAVLQSAKDYTDAQVGALSDSVAQEFTNKVDSLAEVARTGAYNDLTGTPDVPVITMTTADPGEGAALAANHFIGVYNG